MYSLLTSVHNDADDADDADNAGNYNRVIGVTHLKAFFNIIIFSCAKN